MGTTNTNISTDIRNLDVGAIIALYQLDTTSLGGDIYYFTKNTNNGESIIFNGITYYPIDFKIDDIEHSNDSLPRPSFTISNVSLTLHSEIIAYNSLLGSTLTRIRTLKKYLDGESEANPQATFQEDTWILHKKTSHNKLGISWELRSPLDREVLFIPRRQILRELCTFNYRTYDTDESDFVYDTANPCPYTGTDYFDKDGNVTTIANDRCGKNLDSCLLRFAPSAGIPFSGFPMVSRIRV